MKNVAKKSTSLKPSNPPQNGVQERLSNGFISGDEHDIDDMTVEQVSSEENGDDDIAKAVIVSDDRVVSEARDDETMHKNSTTIDENSNDSLLEVSCVNVVDDPKSPFNDGNTGGSRCSTPASMTGASSKDLSGAVNGVGDIHLSDDEVIFCEPSSPDPHPSSTKAPTSQVRSTAEDSSDKWRTNGPVCRVENCEIFENKTEAESDDIPSKPDGVGGTITAADDHDDIEVIEDIDTDNSTPAVVGTTNANRSDRSGVKRNLSDSSPNDVNQQKKSRLEAAEAEVLTSFVGTQHTADRENKVVLTAKQLDDLILSCIESFLSKSHGSLIKQLKTEIDDLRRSRDHWKIIANQMRKQVALVQTAQQRNERRRSSNSRVQKRNVSCQAYIKIPTGTTQSPGKASASANASLEASKLATMSNLSAPTQLLGSLVSQSPSILPPASANLVGTQRLKLIHQPNIRNALSGVMNGPSRPVGVTMLPLSVRPPPAMPNSSAVMIDLTAEEDIRLKQPSAVDALIPAGLLGSVRPGNVVFSQSNNNAYFLYAPPLRSTVLKPGTELEMSGTGGLPAGLTLGTSMAPGTSYHSLPSLVSVNNRHPGTLLQVVNMRPPPPLQSAPLRPALQQSQPLPILPVSSAPRQITTAPLVHQHHPAPLPAPPGVQPVPAGAKQIPPKPTLKLSRVAQGIVLSWNATINLNQEEPSTYQLYAYQQGVEQASSSLWKKVGNVKALALPMACTLTQFQVGNKYHFAVRAVDQFGRVGPFSEPGSIHLEGGST